jgi:hypothetical protein
MPTLFFLLILIAHFFGTDDANGIILVLKPLPDKIAKIYKPYPAEEPKS